MDRTNDDNGTNGGGDVDNQRGLLSFLWTLTNAATPPMGAEECRRVPGLEPQKVKAEHVTKRAVQRAWGELRPRDWLVLYRHARHEPDWVSVVSNELSDITGGASIQVSRSEKVGKDVAFLCAEKTLR